MDLSCCEGSLVGESSFNQGQIRHELSARFGAIHAGESDWQASMVKILGSDSDLIVKEQEGHQKGLSLAETYRFRFIMNLSNT